MWKCSVCEARVEDDSWTECWKCGVARSTDARVNERQRRDLEASLARAKNSVCVRCDTPLGYLGTKRFHEGTRQFGFWLGDFGELFVNREAFDVFACPTCGKVEFFVDGLGEDLRPAERKNQNG